MKRAFERELGVQQPWWQWEPARHCRRALERLREREQMTAAYRLVSKILLCQTEQEMCRTTDKTGKHSHYARTNT